MTQPPSPHRTYILDLFSDQLTVRDLVKGILHTIFFHRYFSPIKPSLYVPSSTTTSSTSSQTNSLPLPLPAIDVPEISAAIDTSTAALMAQLTSSSSSPSNVPPGGSRGEIVVRFYDRKSASRRKTAGYAGGWLGKFGGGGGGGGVGQMADEEVCWEEWCLQVVVARPRSEAGEFTCLDCVFVPWCEWTGISVDFCLS